MKAEGSACRQVRRLRSNKDHDMAEPCLQEALQARIWAIAHGQDRAICSRAATDHNQRLAVGSTLCHRVTAATARSTCHMHSWTSTSNKCSSTRCQARQRTQYGQARVHSTSLMSAEQPSCSFRYTSVTHQHRQMQDDNKIYSSEPVASRPPSAKTHSQVQRNSHLQTTKVAKKTDLCHHHSRTTAW